MENKFSLTARGLNILSQLKKSTYDDLAKKDNSIIEIFLDAKIRIIEFKLVNEPPLDKFLEDRVKKEIFSRYNTGITPLKKAEIDNAIYDEDNLSNLFKDTLENDKILKKKIYNTFFKPQKSFVEDPPTENIMSFIRRFLVMPLFPINHYMRGTARTEILTRLYEYFSDQSVDEENKVIESFFEKTDFIASIKDYSIEYNLENNFLAFECILWGLGVLDLEETKYDLSDDFRAKYAQYVHENIQDFTEQDYAFSNQVITRYISTAIFLTSYFNINLEVYINADEAKRAMLKDVTKTEDTNTKLSELETLRLNKPEPSKNSIEDIIRTMNRRKFLVRPTYQRKEVINPSKASSIIESILLGITIPPLFVFKRADGINEVIDGQQRILTILGFIGESYIDHRLETSYSKNHKFKLRKLRILKELEYKSFNHLDEELKDKILDFQLYVIEIDESQNKYFDPIDLFIRLNDKPYPIREHSFEMWNSWVDLEIIQTIKAITKANKNWFYVRQIKRPNDWDRMETEELLTSLAYLEYNKQNKDSRKALDIYQKTQRINTRLSSKSSISSVLQQVTEKKGNIKNDFEEGVKQLKGFLRKIRYILLDFDKSKDELFDYLKEELDDIFQAGKEARYFRRTKQDFYIIWHLINNINFEMIKLHRLDIKEEIKNIFIYIKNIPEEDQDNNIGYNKFINFAERFKIKYSVAHRKIKLTEEEKLELIRKQGNISGLSKTPVFLGDDIEVDHDIPISKGGKDEIENLQIVHKDENREKGARN